jgi:replication factor C small subunit
VNEIWTERYRPKRLDEIVDQDKALILLKSFIIRRNVPNMLFYGPDGTGKTSAVYAISRDLYGESWMENLTYLDASDLFHRGKEYLMEGRFKRFYEQGPILRVFSKIIKEYAGLATIIGRVNEQFTAEFKIISFNHAQSFTIDAQHALRRMMERYSSTTRFILVTRRSSKIIPAIRSRCVNVHFRRISDGAILKLLERISKSEGVEVTDDGLKAIAYTAKGDCRRGINTLQAASVFGKIDAECIFEVQKKKEMKELIEYAFEGDFMGMRKIIDGAIMHGLSGPEILERIHDEILVFPISDREKAYLIGLMGETDLKLLEGMNERIHLEEMLSKFHEMNAKTFLI